MPQMDGWSVLSALKADPIVASIPVIMASFVNEPALATSLGAADYVPKPVDWDQLKARHGTLSASEGDVLVVDDDRRRARPAAQRAGAQRLGGVRGGERREALDQVARGLPQLILLDLTMPVMDGFTFLHELRERPECRDIPVVVLTARDLSANDRKRLDTADKVFSKGHTSLRELAGEVLALAGQHPAANAAGNTARH